jgi:hypothetical protein
LPFTLPGSPGYVEPEDVTLPAGNVQNQCGSGHPPSMLCRARASLQGAALPILEILVIRGP